MGYGKRALQLLIQYYEGKIADLSESTAQPTDQEIQPTDLNEVCTGIFYNFDNTTAYSSKMIVHDSVIRDNCTVQTGFEN